MKKHCMILPLALILCFMVGCQDKAALAELEEFKAQKEVEEQNKALMHKSFEEWNKGNSEFFMEATTPAYVYYSPSGNPNPNSREDAVESVKLFRKGFPDISFSIEDIIAAGDITITRYVIRGTHEGEFMDIHATGKKIEVSGIIISRIENGKWVEEWEEMDTLGLMQQLGMELKPKEEK
ncbi:MAG: ester cyclase [Candidatus Aminicenantes bacterium]|nr:MAG: ester cyclase [Candidatus Aminicenantes bacterium]